MTLINILVLAIIQGAAELLPVSSSAHVIVCAKLMGLEPTQPEMTLLLVMLHTGTMFAVICYFWNSWKESFFCSKKAFGESLKRIAIATVLTGVVGITLKILIERFMFSNTPHAEIELLFGNLRLISIALAAVGVLIIFAGKKVGDEQRESSLGVRESCWIGIVQGFCLPFRGFSRSGATISAGLLLGIARTKVEEFSFALAVVLTPPVIAREVLRLLKAQSAQSLHENGIFGLLAPSLFGMVISFISGILALRWLSSWLERGRWHLFGIYCLCASLIVYLLHRGGY
ncbi:MAG: undecaprenyl-diphosphate phosphatase [Desulfuromonadales bacterium]|nr:undecaprenyl-diphosphate phosphatase [Desulfuromonadales bacterium]